MGKNKWTDASREENGQATIESERTALCMDFLKAHHYSDIEQILFAEVADTHYSLVIEYSDLYDANPRLGILLYEEPSNLLQNFDNGAQDLQERIYHQMKRDKSASLKEYIHVRVSVQGSALDCPETHPTISQIRVKDVGRLLTIHGTVIRSGGIKMLDSERVFECSKCKYRFKRFTDLEMGNSIPLPSVCPSEQACDGVKFRDVEFETRVHDYQEIKIQESMQTLGVGTVPRSIVVVLDDDLVDTIQAGDDIVVTGVLFAKWRPPVKDVRCDLVLTLRANYVRKTNKLKSTIVTTEYDVQQFENFWAQFRNEPLKGRNFILQGICPQVFGLFTVKLAVALTLIGGVQHVNASGARVRGESHLLLVGDPGTGKSQFLKYAVKLSHRPVLTTGLGSTSAGLTVTAVKDGGEWILEAGALVLADGGLCCIDEFDSIREPDRATIHEAMEQQTISVAKAGLVRTLNTRTTVFGVTNPKGQYDPYQPLTVNTTLSAPLLSRFDIVLVLLDTKNPEWDDIVSTHILNEHLKPEKRSEKSDLRQLWTLPMLRSYIQYVRTEFVPVLTTAAEKVIICYYQLQRRSAMENTARTTVRMLESLIRLAQAHARLMFRKQVLRTDAIAAVICIESSMNTSAILDNIGNALHSTFAVKPDEEYAKQEQTILAALKLDKDGAPPGERLYPIFTGSHTARAGERPRDREENVSREPRPPCDDVICEEDPPQAARKRGTDDSPIVIHETSPQNSRGVQGLHSEQPDEEPALPRGKQAKCVNGSRLVQQSTQNILARLKGKEKMTTQNRSEDLDLSTQYSLP